jgi:hypothetical protein
MALKRLPVGIEFFDEFLTDNYYYVDKTGFIGELLDSGGKVNLFTRPRRFGKSLNMNMLKTFFEIGCDEKLFEGLEISKRSDLCEEYMGKFPVVWLTLKDVAGLNFESACAGMRAVISGEAGRLSFLEDSDRLSDKEKVKYQELVEYVNGESCRMSDDVMELSIRTLCELLYKHYGKKVIVIIDEYDVPLAKAFQVGYYDEMVSLIRNIFSNALKTNQYLNFAVLTGCLRISKESIFTGLNNLKTLTVTDIRFNEYFGFTDDEVKALLEYYGLGSHYDEVRSWYDGYQFGNASVYCPWDVINHVDKLRADPKAWPENYWANTSGNDMVRRFVDKADKQTRDEIELLIAGESVVKEIRQELTYRELDTTIDNIWSVLFSTGYLTQHGSEDGRRYRLAIPNREITELFVSQIREWFKDTIKNDTTKLDAFCESFPAGDAETAENLLNEYLWNTISVRDVAVKKERKENFYHGILLGLLAHKTNWLVLSNVESGEGYCDILVEVPESRTGVVIEVKYAEDDKLEEACAEALSQISDKKYDAHLKLDGMKTIVKFGIACFRKHCRVVKGE